MLNFFRLLFSTAIISFSTFAKANDSQIGSIAGQLQFIKNKSISIESENLTIAPHSIRVEYEFLNKTKTVQSIDLGFPLPSCSFRQFSDFGWEYDCYNRVAMQLSVDGQEVSGQWKIFYSLNQKQLKLDIDPLFAHGDGEILPLLEKNQACPYEGYTKEQCDSFVQEYRTFCKALLSEAPSLTCSQAMDKLSVSYVFMWRHSFQPGTVVKVVHEYGKKKLEANQTQFVSGGAVMGYHPSYFSFLENDLCELPGEAPPNERKLGCGLSWQRYVLKTGSNWNGPIKNFRLTLKKPKDAREIFSCFQGLRTLASGDAVVEIKNFNPKRDLTVVWQNDSGCSDSVPLYRGSKKVVPPQLVELCRDKQGCTAQLGEDSGIGPKCKNPKARFREMSLFTDGRIDALCLFEEGNIPMRAIRMKKQGNKWKKMKVIDGKFDAKQQAPWPGLEELEAVLDK